MNKVNRDKLEEILRHNELFGFPDAGDLERIGEGQLVDLLYSLETALSLLDRIENKVYTGHTKSSLPEDDSIYSDISEFLEK